VSLIKGTPAKFIDYILAPDAETAEKQVAEEHRIPDTLRDRLVAIREDWREALQSGGLKGSYAMMTSALIFLAGLACGYGIRGVVSSPAEKT
jgi:hypothetical protein